MMTEFSKIIEDLENKFNELSKSETKNRFEIIDSSLRVGKLSENLNLNELLYIHTKLHMLFSFSKPMIGKEIIRNMHDKIKSQLKIHVNTDKLDEINTNI